LLAPLIYREAVNDIAGLFVRTAAHGAGSGGELLQPEDTDSVSSSGLPDGAGAGNANQATAGAKGAAKGIREPHRLHHVAPRTPVQTFKTLMWAVALLFAINVFSHFCSLAADQQTVRLASHIEADFIQSTFSHVLTLPLPFFARRASGGLAKQIDQSDEIAPIVTAFAKELAPAVITMAGVMIIMLTQSWKLSLVALVTLPPTPGSSCAPQSASKPGWHATTKCGTACPHASRMHSVPSRR
jgi:ABC-type multidrug transport system fused ATPase/permease subunit